MAVDYKMSDKKTAKLERVKTFFDNKGLFYDEKPNGQLVFENTVSLWATTEKWHDSATQKSGVGVNSFINYLNTK